MSNEEKEISPVIFGAVDLMKKVNESLEVEFLSGMRRATIGKDENGLLSPLGVSTRMTLLGVSKSVFLGYQNCEDILLPMGDLIALELIMLLFKEELTQ